MFSSPIVSFPSRALIVSLLDRREFPCIAARQGHSTCAPPRGPRLTVGWADVASIEPGDDLIGQPGDDAVGVRIGQHQDHVRSAGSY